MYKFYDFIVDNIAYKFTDSSNTSVETARKEYYYEQENIVFPSSVTYGGMAHQVVAIGDFTLHNSAKVKTVTIPSSVRRIGCHALSYLPELETISLPSSCETVGEGAFFGCEKLSSVNLGYVTYIGQYAFYSCKKLTSVSFSNNLVELGNYSFACCRMLSSITIPQHCHLTSGGGTFLGVDLSSVACNVVSPQKIPDSTFSERTYYYVDLRVPSESAAAYGHTPHWTLFRSINGSAPQLYYVTAEPTSFTNISASGVSNQITVMSNTSWTASSNQSWCTLSATSGSNNSTVNFTVGTNSQQSSRSATITFRISTGNTAIVSLSQAGQSVPAHTLTVSPTSVTKDSQAANNITLTVTSDTSWTVHSYETWCVIDTPASGSGTGNGTITFHITQNGGSERQCTINVNGTDAPSVSVTVKQQAADGGGGVTFGVRFIYDVIQRPNTDITRALNNPGIFCQIYLSDSGTIMNTVRNDSMTFNQYTLTEDEIALGYVLGSNNSITFGHNIIDNSIMVYDSQCPNCVNTYNHVSDDYEIIMNQTNGTAYCPHCNRVYDLNNGGIIISGGSDDDRTLVRYHYSYDEQTFIVISNLTTANQTTLLYFTDKSASGQMTAKLQEIELGIQNLDTTTYENNNLLIYCNKNVSGETAKIFRYKKNDSGVEREILVEDNNNMTIQNVVSCINSFPANRYSLVYATYNMVNNSEQKNIYELAINLKPILQNYHLSYIFFDMSFMLSAEVVYELHNCTDYIIGTPEDPPQIGISYTDLVANIFDDNAPKLITQIYSSQTTENSIAAGLVKTSELESLASVTKNLLDLSSSQLQNATEYMNESTTTPFHTGYYDLDNMIHLCADSSSYAGWKMQFSLAVTLKYTHGDDIGCLSHYLPGAPGTTPEATAWRYTQWYQDVVKNTPSGELTLKPVLMSSCRQVAEEKQSSSI